MFINEGNVKIELDFYECWDIGNSIINNITKKEDATHWGRLNYSGFLEYHSKSIKLARQFCVFSNPEWIDHKLADFKEEVETLNKVNKK